MNFTVLSGKKVIRGVRRVPCRLIFLFNHHPLRAHRLIIRFAKGVYTTRMIRVVGISLIVRFATITENHLLVHSAVELINSSRTKPSFPKPVMQILKSFVIKIIRWL
jgi:hypothetical protein